MRFMMMTKDTTGDSAATPPDEAMMAEMGRFIEETSKSGVLLATGGLDPRAITITSSGGKITVTDGPYTEAKEAVVGFALVEVRSKEEAIELSRRFWSIVGDGEGVIQQVFGPGDDAHGQ
ncbi:YciI family protein [Actinomadura roseirufa]|uniref:YciI family protein n=1 Tax=Actinomadura roseirufa TaxID=2094049 RepID=UPI001A954AC8|nr:YciI family protein [Actinomadura roseirufa]